MQQTTSAIARQLQSDLARLRGEASAVNDTLVRPSWEKHTHHFPATLWSYVMAGFSHLDLYSRLWDGDRTRSQTGRMRAFLTAFFPRDPLADALAVQLWRHTLMHTSRPRRLRNRETGQEYTYLLHWGPPELPRGHHYRVERSTQLIFGLEYFLEDLNSLLTAYLGDLADSPDLQARAAAVWPKIETQDFSV